MPTAAPRGDGEALVEHTMFSIQGGVAAAHRLINRDATAIICASDMLALGVIRHAHRAGLGVPRDLSVVGFDDSALMVCTDPPLTTVRQPIAAMGQAAVAQLLSQVGGSRSRARSSSSSPSSSYGPRPPLRLPCALPSLEPLATIKFLQSL